MSSTTMGGTEAKPVTKSKVRTTLTLSRLEEVPGVRSTQIILDQLTRAAPCELYHALPSFRLITAEALTMGYEPFAFVPAQICGIIPETCFAARENNSEMRKMDGSVKRRRRMRYLISPPFPHSKDRTNKQAAFPIATLAETVLTQSPTRFAITKV